MYFSVGISLFILLCLALCFWRKHCAIKKVRSMSCAKKCELLTSILTPFGYCYNSSQDIISTRNDAWQRQAGYTALFDHAALSFHMVFDALPIYFHYRGRTWLIELWKGQYGINTGAEVGIYYSDRILSEEEYTDAHFRAVEDKDRLFVKYTLLRNGSPIAVASGITWWLTAFFVGLFSKPSQLSMEIAIRFPDMGMQQSFLTALQELPFLMDFHTCRDEVHICYENGCPLSPICPERCSPLRRLRIRWAQFCNAFFCRLYCFVTRPFSCTLDKILYLYALLPFILRRMLRRLKGVIRS